MTWSTRLPKKSGSRYLITIDGVVRQADLREYPKGNLLWSILPSGSESVNSGNVSAWQKQPAPYKISTKG